MIDLFYSTNRLNIKDKPVFLSVAYSLPIRGINIENDSYQAFLDLNDNNYHDTNDLPNVGIRFAFIKIESFLRLNPTSLL